MKKITAIVLMTWTLALGASAQATVSTQQKGDTERLTLEQCLSMAAQNNRTLQNAALEIQASGEQSKEAFTKYFPQISANVMAFQLFDKLIQIDGTYPQALALISQNLQGMIGQPYSISEFDKAFQAAAVLAMPLYAGGQIHNGNKLAKVGEEVNILQKDLKEKEVRQKVTESFWQIAKVKYNLQTISAAEKQIEAVQKQVQDYVDAGVANRNALLQVKLRQQELASNRLKLENAQHVLCMLLAQEIGATTSTQGENGSSVATIDIVLPENTEAVMLPEHINPDDAALNRSELKLAGKGVEAQKLQVKMERGKLLPTLAVGAAGFHIGMGGFSDLAKSNLKTSMNNGLAFGTLSVPISAWWGGSHAIRRQKLKLQESQNTYLDAKEQLAIDIEAAWSNLTEAYKQIDIAKASVEESEENLRLNTDQYKAGTSTITDLLDAETLNRKSHDQLSSALADYQAKRADYERKTR